MGFVRCFAATRAGRCCSTGEWLRREWARKEPRMTRSTAFADAPEAVPQETRFALALGSPDGGSGLFSFRVFASNSTLSHQPRRLSSGRVSRRLIADHARIARNTRITHKNNSFGNGLIITMYESVLRLRVSYAYGLLLWGAIVAARLASIDIRTLATRSPGQTCRRAELPRRRPAIPSTSASIAYRRLLPPTASVAA